MIVTTKWMKEKYDEFNARYFEGKLPNIQFKVNNTNSRWGTASYHYSLSRGTITPTEIKMSNYHDSPEKVKINTLLHEMIHIADYTFHPEHFLVRDRWTGKYKRRRYDAHGPIFFLPEAARLNKDGWGIDAHVTQDEIESSTLSADNQMKLDKKKRTGVTFFIIHYAHPYILTRMGNAMYHYGYCKVGTRRDDYLVKFEDCVARGEVKYVDEYVSHTEEGVKAPTSKERRWYLTNDPEGIIEKYSLEYVGTVAGRTHSVIKQDKQDDNNEITTGTMEPKEKKIPVFTMRLNNGRVFTIENVTEDELRAAIKKQFPNWSEDAINKLIANPSFFPKGKGLEENCEHGLIDEETEGGDATDAFTRVIPITKDSGIVEME